MIQRMCNVMSCRNSVRIDCMATQVQTQPYTKNRTMGPLLIWDGLHGKDLYNVYLYWFWWKIQHSVVYHEIRQISWWNLAEFMHEIWQISWQGLLQCISVLVLMKNTAFSGIPWNLADFMVKFGGFHAWNLADFMHGIWQISWPWNLADFMKSTRFHAIKQKSSIHEIQQISWWNLADFMKSGEFHEIWQISSMKSGGFHGWSWKMQTWKCKLL